MIRRPVRDPLADTFGKQIMDEAMRRFAVLRPHIEEGVSLVSVAQQQTFVESAAKDQYEPRAALDTSRLRASSG